MNKKIKTFLLLLLFSFTVLITGKVLADNLTSNSNEGKISVNKTAAIDETDNRKANVTLSVGGNEYTKSTTLDVVLVIDRSTSMNDPVSEDDDQTRMQATKDAANSLVTKLLGNNTVDNTFVNMAIVTFGSDVIDSYRDYDNDYNYVNVPLTSTSLTSNATTIKTLINNIPNHIGDYGDDMDQQGTNVQSGLERAGELLANSTADEKIIILLSDGHPNLFNYNGDTYGDGQYDTEDCIAYECDEILGIICSCTEYKTPSAAAKEEATELKTATETSKAVTIYTVGYGLGDDTTTKQFLQDIATSTSHAYTADKTSDLEKKFEEIVKSITTIATDVKVTDTIPAEFILNEAAIKDAYGNEVIGPVTNEDGSTTTTYKKIEKIVQNEDGTTTTIYSDIIAVTKNTNKTTTIEWTIGDLSVTATETFTYEVTAKDDYYGGMYTNTDAILEGNTSKENPAYPTGKVEEKFPMPIAAISMKTANDNYSAKLGENLNVNATNGILKNDSTIKLTDGEGTIVTNEVSIKSASCGNKSDIIVNADGSFTYKPNSVCYDGTNNQVTFEYEVKSTVTINGKSQVVTSNTSTITIDLTKENSSVEEPTVTKTNNNGETTTSITGPFSYTIKYTATVENHIGTTTVTIVDTLPYQLDETKANNLADGEYDATSKTITWVEPIEDINSYQNQNNEIEIEKTITVYYKDVPNTVEKIINSANVTTDIDNNPTEGTNEIIVTRGEVEVEYVDNLGNTLLSPTTSKGLIDTTYTTNANNIITVSGVEYQLVATKVNGEKVDKTNNYSGTYKEEKTTVTYVYYKVTGDIDTDKTAFTKEGPTTVTKSDSNFDYTITYNTKIDNYIGNATVTIVDTLPLQIDESASNLDGGTYNATNKTITWIIPLNNINTYEEGTYPVNITKNISVVFTNLDANERTLTNNVKATIETSKSNDEKETSEITTLEIKGKVIAHYVDTTGATIATDAKMSDLVGNEYTTSAKDIKGYTLVSTNGNTTGTYIDGTIEVTYIYYRETGEIDGDTISKTGTNKVEKVTDEFNYEIKYSTTIKNYIGDATVTIVDTLPLPIDEAKSDLNGGKYEYKNGIATITWTENIKGIDTNTNGNKLIEITKNIKVTYIGLEATTREITNSVIGTIKTDVSEEKTDEIEKTTSVQVKGTVTAHYVNTTGATIAPDAQTSDLVGNSYATTAKTIDGYTLVETVGNTTGTYAVEPIEVTYIYYEVKGNIEDNKITKYGTEEVDEVTDEFIYTITYKTTVKDYIGDATVTIVDTLPLPIDEAKSDLNGGKYEYKDGVATITWTENIKGIDTNTNGNKLIEVTKNIKVTYIGLEATTRKITNSVVGTITTTIKEESTEPVTKETLVKVNGTVTTHYVDTTGATIVSDTTNSGLVGNEYTTSAKDIAGYQLIDTIGNTTGTYAVEPIEVTYVYYRETGEIDGDTISKTGTNKVEKVTDEFNYEIKYSTTIKNYIGDATVTIVDTLPLPIDEAKSDLNGGKYEYKDGVATITWTENIKGIDTNTNGNKLIEITKNIKVTYIGLEATTREITNSVIGTIKTDISEEKTDEIEKTTSVQVNGKVIIRYVDTNGKTIAEAAEKTGLVGNEYVTNAIDITGYQLVDTIGNTTGTYAVEPTEVTYVYYRETGDITNNEVEKTGAESITLKDEKFEYNIKYTTEINNYIGDATVTIIDYLPKAIDVTESDLAGGIYDKENQTITWVINYTNINTYTNGIYPIEINKDLLLKYKDLDLTVDKITNNVSVTVKTDVSEKTVEDGSETKIDVNGNVVINYVDENGNVLTAPITLTGKLGSIYETEAKLFEGYELIKIDGEVTGEYTEEQIIITYIYTELGKGGDVEVLPPQTGVNATNTTVLYNIIISLIASLFLVIKKFI